MLADTWKWIRRAYYGDQARPPAAPGQVAEEVTVCTDDDRDRERRRMEARPDVARVEAYRYS